MGVSVIYQGVTFDVDESLDSVLAVKDSIQQQLMMVRFIESAWVEGTVAELPAAWLPNENGRKRGDYDTEGESSTAATYTVFPRDASEGVLHHPYIVLPLADGRKLSILVHDNLEIAVLG